MRHLIVLGFDDSASAQAVRSAVQQAEPSQLTILAEETLAPSAPPAAKRPRALALVARAPLAMVAGFFASIYYGTQWVSQTLETVSNYLREPQVTPNGQAPCGRMVLLVDEAQAETFVDQFKQLGAKVQEVNLSATEQG